MLRFHTDVFGFKVSLGASVGDETISTGGGMLIPDVGDSG
jgi:hypothetical protein